MNSTTSLKRVSQGRECTYLRAISVLGKIHCSLIIGKVRVAPTKVTTGPRLKLSATVVAI